MHLFIIFNAFRYFFVSEQTKLLTDHTSIHHTQSAVRSELVTRRTSKVNLKKLFSHVTSQTHFLMAVFTIKLMFTLRTHQC